MTTYDGAQWVRDFGITPSPLGAEVADILGQVYQGLYHLPVARTGDGETRFPKGIVWTDPQCIQVRLDDTLPTFDGSRLTWLVLLCHERCVRCEIRARGGYLLLTFHQRRTRSERSHTWFIHPTIEQAIDHFKKFGISIGEVDL